MSSIAFPRNLEDKEDPWNLFRSAPENAKYYHNVKKQKAVWQCADTAIRPTTIPILHRQITTRPDLDQQATSYEQSRREQDAGVDGDRKRVERVRHEERRLQHRTVASNRAQLEARARQPVHGDIRPVSAPEHLMTSSKKNMKKKWSVKHTRPEPIDAGGWRHPGGQALGAKMIEQRVADRWDQEMDRLVKRDELKVDVYKHFRKQMRENKDRLNGVATEYGHDVGGVVGSVTAADTRFNVLARPKQTYEVSHEIPPDHLDLLQLNRSATRKWTYNIPQTKPGARTLSSSRSAEHLHGPRPRRPRTTPMQAKSLSQSQSVASLRPTTTAGHKTRHGYDEWEDHEASGYKSELAAFERRLTHKEKKNKKKPRPLYLRPAPRWKLPPSDEADEVAYGVA